MFENNLFCRKKTRTGRATNQQYSRMLDFFLAEKGLAEGKFHVINGKEETKKKWEELAVELNGMNGANKTAEQWQVVCILLQYIQLLYIFD